MEDLVAASAAERRFALVVFETFALATLVLAAGGLYGVLSGVTEERSDEMRLRAALGASRRSIVNLVVSQGMRLAAAGVTIGVIGAWATTRLITAMLFDTSRLDPMTYGAVVVLLLAVAVVASGIQAWRASRVDPAGTLRAE